MYFVKEIPINVKKKDYLWLWFHCFYFYISLSLFFKFICSVAFLVWDKISVWEGDGLDKLIGVPQIHKLIHTKKSLQFPVMFSASEAIYNTTWN